MVNQQLKDYIDEQVRVGVSRDAIKSALLEAGWNAAEVGEAMGGGMSPVQHMDAVKPAMPAAVRPVQTQQPVMRNPQPVASQPMQPSQPRMMSTVSAKPMASMAAPSMGVTASDRPLARKSGHRMIDLVMGVSIFILGMAATWFAINNSNLDSALGLAESEHETVVNEAASLRTNNQALQAENVALAEERDDLASQLGVLVSTRTSGEEAVSIKGILGVAGDKAPYTLRASSGLVVTLKNSRTAGLEAMLKDSLGELVQIEGTHVVGSKDITVLTVNGFEPAAPVTASSTASSTAQ